MSWVALELDDDPETLRAALALIDTLDDGVNADTATEQTDRSTSTSTSDSDQAEKRSEGEDEVLPTDTSKTRTKRGPRQEILTLRAKVDELENTLKRQKTNADLVLNSGSDVLTVSNVWKEVAKRQHRYRRESEMENLRLRTMLQSQIMIGEQLVHFIQKNLEGQPGYDEVMIEANASHSGKPPLRMTREQQYNYLDDLYRQSNEIFAATSFQTNSTSYRDIRVTNDADGGSIIELHAGWVVPFPMHDVTKALWEAIALRADGSICKTMRMNIEAQEDAILTSFSVVASSFDDDFATGFAGNMVTRRFDHNSSQNVIVSTMLGEMLGKVPSLMDYVSVFKEDWMRVREVTTVVDADSTPLSQVQCIQRLKLSFDGNATEKRGRITKAITEMLLSQVEHHIAWKQQSLEHLLLVAE